MKKINIKKALLAVAAIAVLIVGPMAFDHVFCSFYQTKAQPLIDIVEQYKEATGHAPRSSSDIGYDDSTTGSGPFYQYIDSIHYMIYYADEFGRFYVYDPATRQWKNSTTVPH